MQRGAETLAGREGLDAAHAPSEGQVVGPAGAPVHVRRQILSSGLERTGTSIFQGRADVRRETSDGRLSLGRSQEVDEGCHRLLLLVEQLCNPRRWGVHVWHSRPVVSLVGKARWADFRWRHLRV